MEQSYTSKLFEPKFLPSVVQLLLLLALPLFAIYQYYFHCPSDPSSTSPTSSSSSSSLPPVCRIDWAKPSSKIQTTTTTIVFGCWMATLCFVALRLRSIYHHHHFNNNNNEEEEEEEDPCQRRKRLETERATNSKRMAMFDTTKDILKMLEKAATEKIRSGMYRKEESRSFSVDDHNGVGSTENETEKCGEEEEKEEEESQQQHQHSTTETVVTCLNALALRFHTSSSTSDHDDDNTNEETLLLPQSCVRASFTVLHSHPNDDEAITASFSLLALVASSSVPSIAAAAVPTEEEEGWGLGYMVGVMKRALERTKAVEDYARTGFYGGGGSSSMTEEEKKKTKENRKRRFYVQEAEEREHISAEFQRRACLYLGAIAETDRKQTTSIINKSAAATATTTGTRQPVSAIAAAITDEGGLEAILDAVTWFRYYVPVVNWALWALFTICYEHGPNKREFVRNNGVGRVCIVLGCVLSDVVAKREASPPKKSVSHDHSKSSTNTDDDDVIVGVEEEDDEDERTEVLRAVRHGIALLFDALRYDESEPGLAFDHNNTRSELLQRHSDQRRIALNAGLADVVRTAMETFPGSKEIVMMGQQMLVTVVGVGGSMKTTNIGGSGGAMVSKEKNWKRRNPSVKV